MVHIQVWMNHEHFELHFQNLVCKLMVGEMMMMEVMMMEVMMMGVMMMVIDEQHYFFKLSTRFV